MSQRLRVRGHVSLLGSTALLVSCCPKWRSAGISRVCVWVGGSERCLDGGATSSEIQELHGSDMVEELSRSVSSSSLFTFQSSPMSASWILDPCSRHNFPPEGSQRHSPFRLKGDGLANLIRFPPGRCGNIQLSDPEHSGGFIYLMWPGNT